MECILNSGIRLILLRASTTTKTTSATSGDETDLGTSRRVTANGGRVTDVLMVTTSVRVIHGLICEIRKDGYVRS